MRLVTCCAFSHVKHAMAICSTLPAYSDRIARELHPIPSNQTESGHLLKNVYEGIIAQPGRKEKRGVISCDCSQREISYT